MEKNSWVRPHSAGNFSIGPQPACTLQPAKPKPALPQPALSPTHKTLAIPNSFKFGFDSQISIAEKVPGAGEVFCKKAGDLNFENYSFSNLFDTQIGVTKFKFNFFFELSPFKYTFI